MAQGIERSIEEILSLVQTTIPYIKNGSSLKKACQICKIPYTSVLEYRDKYQDVRIILEEAESYLDTIAESIIADKIIREKNVKVAQWWLERSQKDRYSAFNKTLFACSEDESKKIEVQIIDYSKYYKPNTEKTGIS